MTGLRAAAVRFLAITLVAGASAFPRAAAQSWVAPDGPGGEAWLSLGYGNNFVTRHFLGTQAEPGDSVETDRGHIRAHVAGFELGYNISNRLAASVALPFVVTKWYGPRAQAHVDPNDGSTIDDGGYHGTFADWALNVRYRAVTGTIALSPFVGAVLPSHSYRYFAHSAAGRDLHEYILGFTAGANLSRVLPGSYVQMTYAYAFVERIADIRHDRSSGDLEIGYELLPSLSARFMGTGHYTHGGIVFKNGRSIPPDLFVHHDQIDKSSAINIGGGLSYQLSGSVEISASYLRTMQGRGGHKLDHGLSLGATWSFSPRQLVRRYFPASRATTPSS